MKLSTEHALTRDEFEQARVWGLSTSVDLYGCDPAAIRSTEAIARFTRDLCSLLDVACYGDPRIVRFGRDPQVYGYSMVQLIETSLVSAHFAEESNAVYLDIFSCKWYDAAAAAEFARECFSAGRIRIHSCLRR